jgi:DNA-binding response OmpR family regulator
LEGSPSILVVDDEAVILHLMEEALEEGGFKVVLAPSGERAVQALDAQTAPFRAIVTDINLGPGMCGWDVAKHARETDPDIAVIYITAHGADEWASHGLPKSVLITKPFAVAQLVTAVSQLLNASPPTTPE